MAHPRDLSDTNKQRAIVEDAVERVAGRMSRNTPISGPSASEVELAIIKRCEECQKPDGANGALAEKVDQLRISSWRQNGGLAVLIFVATIGVGLWQNSKANDRLTLQIEMAAKVAAQLKAVHDAAERGHTSLPVPTDHFATAEGAGR
jgi:hypothetical protein